MKKLTFVKIITVFMLICLLSSCVNEAVTSGRSEINSPADGGVRKRTTTTAAREDLPKLVFSAGMLDGCKINLSGIKSLGVESRKITAPSDETTTMTTKKNMGSTTTRRSENSVTTSGVGNGSNKNFLVGVTADRNYSDIVFEKSAGVQIYQEQIPGQIDRLFVTKKLTYMRFTTNVYSSDPENATAFESGRYYQSYAVDNVSGKVFSLEKLGINAEIVGDGYILTSEGVCYITEVSGDELALTKLSYESIFYIQYIFQDKYGTYFIPTDKEAKRVDNIVYYQSYAAKTHFTGNDGLMYVWDENTGALEYYNSSKQLTRVGDSSKAVLTLAVGFSEYNYFLVLNISTLLVCNSSSIIVCKKTGNVFFQINDFSSYNEMGAADGELFEIDGGYLYHTAYNPNSNSLHKTTLNIRARELYREGNNLIALDNNDKEYRVYMQNGTPKTELFTREEIPGLLTDQSLSR